MKRVTILALILLLAVGLLWAEEGEKKLTGAVSFILTDSLAFMGLGGELFFGNLGLGATFTGFIVGTSGGTVFLLEPGAYGRLYLGDLSSCFYLMGGASYFTFGASAEGLTSMADARLLNINTGIGYNALFGKKNNTRFSVEMGPRYTLPVWGEDKGQGFFFPHFALMFGMAF